MSLRARISEDIKTAMKAQNKPRLQTLRMVLSELKYAQANANVHEDLPAAEEVKVVSTYQKRLEKSLADYPDGDAKTAILGEIAIVNEYLPTKVERDVVEHFIIELLQKSQDRQFGTLMKQVMAHFGDSADGKTVSDVLKKALATPG